MTPKGYQQFNKILRVTELYDLDRRRGDWDLSYHLWPLNIIALESGEYYTCVSWKVDELMQYLSWLSQGHQESAGFKLTLLDCDLIEYNTSVHQNCFYKEQKSMDLIFAVLC